MFRMNMGNQSIKKNPVKESGALTSSNTWCIFEAIAVASCIDLETLNSLPGLPGWLSGKESTCQCRSHMIWSLGGEDPPKEETATH